MLLRMSPPLRTRRKAAYLPFDLQRPAVHDEEPHVALRRGGEVLLRDHEPVAADGVDHLVEVGDVVGSNEEHAGAARALQRLQDDVAALLLAKSLISSRSRVMSVRGRTSSGNSWKYILLAGLGQAVWIVDDDDAAPHGQAAELGGGRGRPRPVEEVVGGHVAQHQDVEIVDA